jgi:aspartate kinase
MGSEGLPNGQYDQGPRKPSLLQNESPKPWIVQKFGGTSVGKFAEDIAENIVK